MVQEEEEGLRILRRWLPLLESHNDVVYRVLRHFEASPETIPEYPVIVVDELQDYSLLETKFIELLGSKSPVLMGPSEVAGAGFEPATSGL